MGPKKLLKLLNIFNDLDEICNASDSTLLRTRIFTPIMIDEWRKNRHNAEKEYGSLIDLCEEHKIEIMPLFSEVYPSVLKFVPYSPKTLFLKGDLSLLKSKKVAIVGSRDSNEPAIDWTYKNAYDLAKRGIVIVSGGAKGIDYAAHKGALESGGKTICIFGTGLLNYYPMEHSDLFDSISENGLLISEHFPYFTGGRIALLNRNRITSGISDALIQVTSGIGTGSATQMKMALEQNVHVFSPKIEFGFAPHEGIDVEINSITQIENSNDIFEFLSNNEISVNSTKQSKLFQ